MSLGTHDHTHPPALIDRAMWSFPVHHPDAQLRIGALLHLTGTAPPVGRLRDHVAERLPALPALTHFLTGTGSGWTRAPFVDPAVHVVEHVLPPGGEHLDREVQRLIRVPLPEGAPHWRVDLLRGHEPGRYALLYLVHHAMQDGAGILHTLETLFTARAIPESQSSAVVPCLSPAPPVTLRDCFRAVATTARAGGRSGIWASARHPLSARRTFRWAQVPVERLREVGHARGGSVNDAYLATLAHAVQDWAGDHWPPARRSAELPMIMPANLRRPGEAAAPGNKVVMIPLALPGGDVPLAERLDGAIRATAPLRCPRHREALRRAVSLSYVPAWALPRLLRTAGRPGRAAVGVSGLLVRHDLQLGGDPVTRVLPVGCLPEASPLGSLMLTYRGISTVCFMTDRALPGLDTLHLRWRRAVEG